ncbi:MAG: SGNH/GDSL hydrolase family protein [Planctomycetes bacterium]|nr:SGNH/GDSL hydrolase family protein [Planctomycetota bacterium]
MLGDSVTWGNGLEQALKASSLLAEEIGSPADSQVRRRVSLQTYAYTGAKIRRSKGDRPVEVNDSGEVPLWQPSILEQVRQVKRPEEQDLVLLSGCVNDVDVRTIIDPTTTVADLEVLIVGSCLDSMTDLLRLVRQELPNARIIVTGYYPILSSESFSDSAEIIAGLLRIYGVTAGAEDRSGQLLLARKSRRFADLSRDSLAAAIAAINADSPDET